MGPRAPLRSRWRRPAALVALMWANLVAAQAPGAALEIHDRVTLAGQRVAGLQLNELSGLAWDADEQRLYAVSDKGRVFHFQFTVADRRIVTLQPLHAAALRDHRSGEPVPTRFNAEGLALLDADNGIRGDTQLLVALENGPRVMRFTPEGQAIAEIALPPALRDPQRYQTDNSRLESIAVHPRHGFVMAPQRPLKGEPPERHTIYATDGSRWSFTAHGPRSEIKAIDTLGNGRLLILERSGTRGERSTVLRELDPSACAADGACQAPELGGAADLGNDKYEGLARLSDKAYLIVSDNAANPRLHTMFVLLGRVAP